MFAALSPRVCGATALSHFSSVFWVITLLLIGAGVAILAIASKSGAARGWPHNAVDLWKDFGEYRFGCEVVA